MRAAWRRVVLWLSDRSITVPGPTKDQPDPDLRLLAALALAGLVGPTDVLLIALIETARHRDR